METFITILKIVWPSTALAALIAGICGIIKAKINANNKALRRDNELLQRENTDLTSRIAELQQTVSEQAAAIAELRDQQTQYHSQQYDSGHGDYISWDD